MRLPRDVRARFQRYGRQGGQVRAAHLSAASRASIARRAALARWIKQRFGAPCFRDLDLPGGELVDAGLADLAAGKPSAAALAVSIAMPRLRREGLPRIPPLADPEQRLFRLLSSQSTDLAHARYNAYLQQMASFAAACHGRRVDRMQRAS